MAGLKSEVFHYPEAYQEFRGMPTGLGIEKFTS